ncbi:MAG: AI-2E family transporter [Arachnia sp.]
MSKSDQVVEPKEPSGDVAATPAEDDAPEAVSSSGQGGVPVIVWVAVMLGASGLALALFREYRDIIAPVFLAVNLVLTAYPVFRWLKGRGAPRWVAASATGATVLVILVGGAGAIVWSLTSMVTTLSGYRAQFQQLYQTTINFLGRVGFDERALQEQLASISPTSIVNLVGDILSNASSVGGLVVVVFIAMIFMVMDLPTWTRRSKVARRISPSLASAVDNFAIGIRKYWLVTTVFGLIVAVADGIVLVGLGVSLPLVWAMLSFITNYIPNIGFVLGVIPPALLALFEQGPVTALIVVAAYSALNFVIQSIIQPKFTGDAVGITPFVSFISLIVWTAVFGGLGALIAVPFTLMVKSLLVDPDPHARWVNLLIADDPGVAVKEKSQERLVAPDSSGGEQAA